MTTRDFCVNCLLLLIVLLGWFLVIALLF